MARMDEFKGAKAQFLPKRTYKDKLTLGAGKDQIDLYYFGPGHTNGDTFVVFPALRTMHVGDMFAWKALPYIDPANGGSVVEQPKTLAKVVAGVKNVDTIINGHIPVGTFNDLKEYAEFTQDFVTFAETAIKAGKTADQAAAEYKVAGEIQRLRRQRQRAVRQREGEHADRVHRIEKEIAAGFSRTSRRPAKAGHYGTENGADAITLSHMMASLPPVVRSCRRSSTSADRRRTAACPASSARGRRPCPACSRTRPKSASLFFGIVAGLRRPARHDQRPVVRLQIDEQACRCRAARSCR